MNQYLVGVDVQLLLSFAMYVDLTVFAENVRKAGSANLVLNHFRGHRDAGQQRRKNTGRAWETLLLFENVLLGSEEGDGCGRVRHRLPAFNS